MESEIGGDKDAVAREERRGKGEREKEYGLRSSRKYGANGADPLDGCLMKDA